MARSPLPYSKSRLPPYRVKRCPGTSDPVPGQRPRQLPRSNPTNGINVRNLFMTDPSSPCRRVYSQGGDDGSVSVGKRTRGLAEDVAPAGRRPDVGVAEPKLVLERLSLRGALGPEERGDDRRVAPDADLLRSVVLTLVDGLSAARFGQQIRLRIDLALSRHEDEVVPQDAIHHVGVVLRDRGLILRIERGHGLLVIRGGSPRGRRARPEQDVEERLPALPAVVRGLRGLTDSLFCSFPDAANQHGASIGRSVGPSQGHAAILETPFEGQQLAAVGHPGLVPDPARRVVDAEALAGQTVELLIDLKQGATVEDDVHASSRHELVSLVEPVGVPIAGPEVELAMFSRSAFGGRRGSGARLPRTEDADENGGKQGHERRNALLPSEWFSGPCPACGGLERVGSVLKRDPAQSFLTAGQKQSADRAGDLAVVHHPLRSGSARGGSRRNRRSCDGVRPYSLRMESLKRRTLRKPDSSAT